MNFDIDKLGIALAGHSAGAYKALLYSYYIKNNSPIKVKFVINLCAQATMDPQFWFKFKNSEDSLEKIDQETVDKAIKEGILIPMNDNEGINLIYMNLFMGGIFNEKDLKEMVDKDGKIKRNNEKYIKFSKKVEKIYPVYNICKESVPTINVCAGRDVGVSVCQAMILKKKLDENNIRNDFIYMRYGGHMLNDFETEDGIESLRKIHYSILLYAQNYFK